IIMTSNIGSQWILELGTGRWEEVETRVMEALRSHFRPEFLNRVDDTILFRPLSEDDLLKIVDLQLGRFNAQLAEKKVRLDVTPEAKRLLASEGFDPVYGARPLKRVIQRDLMNPLALEMLQGKVGEGDVVKVGEKGGKLSFSNGRPQPARA